MPQILHLRSDYLCNLPVWADWMGPFQDHVGPITRDMAERLDLPNLLIQDLLHWQKHFERHFSALDGWDTPAAKQWYARRGPERRDRLVTALPEPDYLIMLDMWPTESDE